MILILGLWAVPVLLNNPAADTKKDDFIVDLSDTSIIGLPVDNFSLADIQTDGGIEADRMGYSNLSDFFSYNSPDMFAFVRVLDTEQREERERGLSTLKQDSSLRILSVLWSRSENIPEIITLSQSLYGGCTGDEKTNMLRKGGVYLLPLSYWQSGDTWFLMGDLDVLFEVDDQGRAWTHSSFDGFKRFDGENADVLAKAVTALTSDENFSAAITTFGQIARNWGVLAKTTILSVIPAKDKWGYDCANYTLNADDILSISDERRPWQPEKGDIINAVSYADIDIPHVEQGGRYLIFLDPSEDGPYIEKSRVAKINADGTITAVSEDNIFAGFNGYTVEQMKEAAERAKAWHEAHVITVSDR